PETLVIRILEQQKHIRTGDLVKTIDMNSIRSIIFNEKMFKYRGETNAEETKLDLNVSNKNRNE
ncbi:unnamed protein product, partial [Rotaria sp. Silwood2]